MNLLVSNYTSSMFLVIRLTHYVLLHCKIALIMRDCKNWDTLLIAYYDDLIKAFYSYFIYCRDAILFWFWQLKKHEYKFKSGRYHLIFMANIHSWTCSFSSELSDTFCTASITLPTLSIRSLYTFSLLFSYCLIDLLNLSFIYLNLFRNLFYLLMIDLFC